MNYFLKYLTKLLVLGTNLNYLINKTENMNLLKAIWEIFKELQAETNRLA